MPSRSTKSLPQTFIYKEVVNERVRNFQENKHPLLTQAMEKAESESAWYSLEQFEEMMREMYYQNADGLRIYFGAYNANDPEYANQMTVIFVPTYLDETTGKHTDIVIDDYDDFNTRAAAPMAAGMAKGVIHKNLDTIALCPPSCAEHELAYPY
ncbi:MAG: hypothetical protein WCF67_14295 [Chitinophagaceae bacterium]